MKLILPFLLLICIVNFSQSKKYKKILISDQPDKILELKDDENFQFELDNWLIEAIHYNDTVILDNCLKFGANPNYKCPDCYDRDALMISLFYRNYDAYNKIKKVYVDDHMVDELGYNLLFAAAGCKNETLQEVISSFSPEFITCNLGSSALDYCFLNDGNLNFSNIKTLCENYDQSINEHNFQYRDEDDFSLLMYAVTESNIDITKFLIARGSRPFHISDNILRDSDFGITGAGSAFFMSMSISDRTIYDYFSSIGTDLDQYSGWYRIIEDDESEELYSSLGFYLAYNKNESFVQELEENFDIDYNGYEGIGYYTPMMIAIFEDNLMMVKRILENWDGMFYKAVQRYAKDKEINPEIKVLIDNFVKENIK